MWDGEYRVPWNWVKSFYVLPLVGACCVTGVLWKVQPEHRGRRLVIWAWGLGWPTGLLLWIALWYLLGGASGVPELGIITLALIGWFVWSIALYLSVSEKYWGLGAATCLFVVTILWAIKSTVPHGTGLVALDIEGALIGLLPYFKARGSESLAAVRQALA